MKGKSSLPALVLINMVMQSHVQGGFYMSIPTLLGAGLAP